MSKLSPYWWFVVAATLSFMAALVSVGFLIVLAGHIITGLLWLRRERTRPLIDQMYLVHTRWGRVVIVVFWVPAVILAALRKWRHLHSPARFFMTIPAAEAGDDPSTFPRLDAALASARARAATTQQPVDVYDRAHDDWSPMMHQSLTRSYTVSPDGRVSRTPVL
jgi:hypothetical protein